MTWPALFALAARAVTAQVAPDAPEALRNEAYVAAQRAIASEAGDALSKVAARFAGGSGEIAELETAREQDIAAKRAAEQKYVDLAARSDRASAAERAAAIAERDRLDARIVAAEHRIEAADPAYFELIQPHPLSIAQTQALLDADEALILLLPHEDATYIFAVTRDREGWARASLPAREIDALVASLRGSIIDDMTLRTQTFDRTKAFTLYDRLIRPVEPTLAGKRTVMVVAGGALGTLPFQLFVTDPPTNARTDDAAMRDTHWLADRYLLTTLPGVSSLRALRCLLVSSVRRAAGCDPVNAPSAGWQATKERATPQIEVAGFGAPVLAPGAGLARSAGPPQAGTVFDGRLADPERLRSLPSLPGSLAELRAVQTLFGSDRADIQTGPAATETRVKASTALSHARFVIFSTHGLLASESRFVGASEPGLVFTPPAAGASSDLDDGFLTASEAAKLKLNADLVVLSACNTAADDGTAGSGGLSGLARSFLFAGARSLMVSNWSVNDAATSRIIDGVFTAARAPNPAPFAELLRDAEVKVRAMPGYAAPAYWAPFVLVGVSR